MIKTFNLENHQINMIVMLGKPVQINRSKLIFIGFYLIFAISYLVFVILVRKNDIDRKSLKLFTQKRYFTLVKNQLKFGS